MVPTLPIMGVPISRLTGDQALRVVGDWAEEGTCQTLAYVNAHTLNFSARIDALDESLVRSRLVMNDGIGLSLAARMRGERFPENLNGSAGSDQVSSEAGEVHDQYLAMPEGAANS